MIKNQLPVLGGKTFEELKLINEHGAEYLSARDLQPLLGYGQWRRFEDAIKRIGGTLPEQIQLSTHNRPIRLFLQSFAKACHDKAG